MPVIELLVKIRGKIEIENDIINTSGRCIAYVLSCVGNTAFSHLELRV